MMKYPRLLMVALAATLFSTSLVTAAPTLEDAFQSYVIEKYDEAFAAFQPLAEAGDGRAQFALGNMYSKGQGVARNESEAFKWFQQATQQG